LHRLPGASRSAANVTNPSKHPGNEHRFHFMSFAQVSLRPDNPQGMQADSGEAIMQGASSPSVPQITGERDAVVIVGV
jgi:hypothetical protein